MEREREKKERKETEGRWIEGRGGVRWEGDGQYHRCMQFNLQSNHNNVPKGPGFSSTSPDSSNNMRTTARWLSSSRVLVGYRKAPNRTSIFGRRVLKKTNTQNNICLPLNREHTC